MGQPAACEYQECRVNKGCAIHIISKPL